MSQERLTEWIDFRGGLNVNRLWLDALVVSRLSSDQIVTSLSFDFSSRLLQIEKA